MSARSLSVVILRTRLLGEHDRLVDVMSREEGRLRLVARGAARTGNRWGGRLEPLGRRTFEVTLPRRGGLGVVVASLPRAPGAALYRRLEAMMAGLGMAESILGILPEGLILPEAFALLDDHLEHLPTHALPESAVVAFSWRLLTVLGEVPPTEQWPSGLAAELGPWLSDPDRAAPPDLLSAAEWVAGLLQSASGRPLRGRTLWKQVRRDLPDGGHDALAPPPGDDDVRS